MLLHICPEKEVSHFLITGREVAVAVIGQSFPVLQDITEPAVKSERIDHSVQFVFELISLQIIPKSVPVGEESFAIAIQISPQITDVSRLHPDLLALGIGIHAFRFRHLSDI
ncbi:MAG: hypothetical protein IJ917_04545 [Firmicutes bacterium]|nr:hypothetical protein [Bacillota bacterium]